jgi:HSP20 family protein
MESVQHLARSHGGVPFEERRLGCGRVGTSVDIFETEDAYLFSAELPGVRKEDVNVHIEKGVLVLSGQRKLENEDKIRTYHRLEGTYGAFARSFELPEGADAGSVKASFNNGVLTITVAKAESAKPRKIEVKVA